MHGACTAPHVQACTDMGHAEGMQAPARLGPIWRNWPRCPPHSRCACGVHVRVYGRLRMWGGRMAALYKKRTERACACVTDHVAW